VHIYESCNLHILRLSPDVMSLVFFLIRLVGVKGM
jgi:hypothetical protein